jgi:hypothetical protein
MVILDDRNNVSARPCFPLCFFMYKILVLAHYYIDAGLYAILYQFCCAV